MCGVDARIVDFANFPQDQPGTTKREGAMMVRCEQPLQKLAHWPCNLAAVSPLPVIEVLLWHKSVPVTLLLVTCAGPVLPWTVIFTRTVFCDMTDDAELL